MIGACRMISEAFFDEVTKWCDPNSSDLAESR